MIHRRPFCTIIAEWAGGGGKIVPSFESLEIGVSVRVILQTTQKVYSSVTKITAPFAPSLFLHSTGTEKVVIQKGEDNELVFQEEKN